MVTQELSAAQIPKGLARAFSSEKTGPPVESPIAPQIADTLADLAKRPSGPRGLNEFSDFVSELREAKNFEEISNPARGPRLYRRGPPVGLDRLENSIVLFLRCFSFPATCKNRLG